MRFTDLLTTSLLAAETEAPTIFPFPFSFHLAFAVIGFVFFIISFLKFKRPYQLLFAIGIPFSLLLWAADGNRNLYYGIGIVELIIILGALITSIIFKPKNEEQAAPAAEKAQDTEE